MHSLGCKFKQNVLYLIKMLFEFFYILTENINKFDIESDLSICLCAGLLVDVRVVIMFPDVTEDNNESVISTVPVFSIKVSRRTHAHL